MSEDMRAKKLSMEADAPVVPMAVVSGEKAKLELAEEQILYAKVLNQGMRIGLALLVVTFLLYMLGILAPHTPVADLPRLWAMPVKEYLAAAGIHPGWGWIFKVHRADFLNFVGIAFLAGVTLVCYVSIIPIFLKRRDKVFAAIAVLEVIVLALAASGVLRSGGH